MHRSQVFHREKSSRGRDYFFILAVLACMIVLYFFYRMMVLSGDNPLHLNAARVFLQKNAEQIPYPRQAVTYPLYHLLTKLLAIMLNGQYETAGAVVLTASSISTILITKYLLEQFIKPSAVFCRWMVDMGSICSIFFETLKGPLTEGRYYAGQCAANPWHNPTIIFVRPFGLVTFYLFTVLFRKIKQGETVKKELIVFSVISVLSTLAKPSYTIVLIPAAGVLVLIYWLRDLKGNFMAAAGVLAAVIPTILLILFQFFYGAKEADVFVKVVFGSFSGFTCRQVACASLATFSVPITVCFVCNRKELFSDDRITCAYIALLFGWMQMFTLTNGGSGDFSWGYDLAVGLSTVMAFGYVLKEYYRKWQMYLVLAVFSMQTFFGLQYFCLIQKMGGSYWF